VTVRAAIFFNKNCLLFCYLLAEKTYAALQAAILAHFLL